MSFILDALKKIEEEKRQLTGPGGRESIAIGRGRFGAYGSMWFTAGVAVVSAVTTAATLAILGGGEERVAEPIPPPSELAETVAPEPTEVPPTPGEPETFVLLPTHADASVDPKPEPEEPRAEAEPPPKPVPEPEPDPPPAPEPEPEPEPAAEPEPEPAVEPEPEPEPEPETESPIETEAPPETTPSDEMPPEDDSTGTPAVRLVGMEAAARGTVAPEAEPSDALPEELSGLVLQGTSVIHGQPVAVISDQRVFEGDRIRGALVVRIEERSVELELDGKRFRVRM